MHHSSLSALVIGFAWTSSLLKCVQAQCGATQANCFPSPANRAGAAAASATSTCGLTAAETYSFQGLVQGTGRQDGLVCNGTSHPTLSHPAQRFNDGDNSTWWQASFAIQNVTVELAWQRPILFQSTIMTFRSLPPQAMRLEYSTDSGTTWQTYQYYAIDCMPSFNLPRTAPAQLPSSIDAVCTDDGVLVAGGSDDRRMVS